MSEQENIGRAAAKVIGDAEGAYQRGELNDATFIGFKLIGVAVAMKPPHRPGALAIAQTYCAEVGIDSGVMEEQVSARIYEVMQLEQIEKGLNGD